jgi:hypothetical protein
LNALPQNVLDWKSIENPDIFVRRIPCLLLVIVAIATMVVFWHRKPRSRTYPAHVLSNEFYPSNYGSIQ